MAGPAPLGESLRAPRDPMVNRPPFECRQHLTAGPGAGRFLFSLPPTIQGCFATRWGPTSRPWSIQAPLAPNHGQALASRSPSFIHTTILMVDFADANSNLQSGKPRIAQRDKGNA
jgi:hypothetical protein